MPHLEQWQKDLFTEFNKHPNNTIFVVKSIRQVGKSACLAILLIYTALKEAKSVSKVVSPIFKQSGKLFDDVKRIGAPLITKANESSMVITFINGSKVEFSSAEQGDNLRGFTVKKAGILAIDEAAYIDESFFYSVLLPMTNVHKSNIILFSTPRQRDGLFYHLYQQGIEKQDNVIALDWTTYDTSKFLSNEMLEIYKKQVPFNIFRSEYLGEWMENASAIFGDYSKNIKTPNINNQLKLFAGIDWGTGVGGDYTAITIFDANHQMIFADCWNDLDETATINKIVNILKKYDVYKVTVETNSIGEVFKGLLSKAMKQAGLTKTLLTGFTTTNETKHNIIANFQVELQNDTCSIVENKMLLNQMNAYTASVSKTGKVTYNNDPTIDAHDDMVMSTAIALYSIQKGQYSVSVK